MTFDINNIQLFVIVGLMGIFIYLISIGFGFATRYINRKAQGIEK